jgi:hypothetical protein
MPGEKPTERHSAGRDLALPQHAAELVQRQVRLLGRHGEQDRLVILQRRGTAAARLGRGLAADLPALHPADRRTDAHLEPCRRGMPRLPRFDRFDHPLAQIL